MAHFTPDKQLMESSLHALPTSDLEVNWRQQNQDGTDGLQYVSSIPMPQSKLVTSLPTTLRRILGLSVGMFWVVVAVIVLVFAGGIGGGVAGGLAAQKNSCSQSQQSAAIATPTSTPRATSISASSTSSAAPAGASPQICTPCTGNNAANGSTLVAHDPTAANTALASVPHGFQLLCNTNYPQSSAFGNPNIIDLLRIYTPDMAGCIAACAEYKTGYTVSSGSPRCSAVAVVKAPGEFCYLKSGIGVNDTTSSGGSPIDTAILLNS